MLPQPLQIEPQFGYIIHRFHPIFHLLYFNHLPSQLVFFSCRLNPVNLETLFTLKNTYVYRKELQNNHSCIFLLPHLLNPENMAVFLVVREKYSQIPILNSSQRVIVIRNLTSLWVLTLGFTLNSGHLIYSLVPVGTH